MNERDTHFQGFAKLLMEELDIDPVNDLTQQIIAQRAYDLAYHFVESNYQHRGTFRGEIHASVQMLPDLTSWPDTLPQ